MVSLPPQPRVPKALSVSSVLVQCSSRAQGSLSLQIPLDCSRNLPLLRESLPQGTDPPSWTLPSPWARSLLRIFGLGAPRSTEEDPPHKVHQKYKALANSCVAKEAKGQPCPKKALAGGQAVTGEVSLLCLFPFLRTTTWKKKVPDRAAFAVHKLGAGLLCRAPGAPTDSRLPPELELLLHSSDRGRGNGFELKERIRSGIRRNSSL